MYPYKNGQKSKPNTLEVAIKQAGSSLSCLFSSKYSDSGIWGKVSYTAIFIALTCKSIGYESVSIRAIPLNSFLGT
jgi:hypothetical protein